LLGRNIELAELEFMLNQHKLHANTVGILAAGRIPKIQKTHTHTGDQLKSSPFMHEAALKLTRTQWDNYRY